MDEEVRKTFYNIKELTTIAKNYYFLLVESLNLVQNPNIKYLILKTIKDNFAVKELGN